jgi:serine-type D-Ala-D-Ala endopeptidase (penicillin-binding protein 7)
MTALIVYDLCRERKIDITRTHIILGEDDKKRAVSRNRRVPSPKRFTIEQLLDMALIKSTNEAAEALASGIIPRAEFIARMNQKAATLHMRDTKFDNPSGISSGNKSTV